MWMVLTVYVQIVHTVYTIHIVSMSFNWKSKWSNIQSAFEFRMHIGVFNYSFRHNVFISYAEISANWKPQSHVSSAFSRTSEWIHTVQIVVAHNFVYAKCERIVCLQLCPLFCIHAQWTFVSSSSFSLTHTPRHVKFFKLCSGLYSSFSILRSIIYQKQKSQFDINNSFGNFF